MSRPSSFAPNARKREAPDVEWLVRVGGHFLFKQETLWLAEDLVQRYLAAQVHRRQASQIVRLTAALIAAKFCETDIRTDLISDSLQQGRLYQHGGENAACP